MNSRNYKDVYHGKKDLNILSIIILLISVAIISVGVVLIIVGAKNTGKVATVIEIVFGSLLSIAGLVGLIASIIMLIISNSMKVDIGSVKEGNIAKIGTVNAKMCDICGTELDDSGVCPNCKRE